LGKVPIKSWTHPKEFRKGAAIGRTSAWTAGAYDESHKTRVGIEKGYWKGSKKEESRRCRRLPQWGRKWGGERMKVE